MHPFKALLLTCTLSLLPTLGHAADAAPLTDAQKKEVESIVRELLTKKEPEIIIKAAQLIQEKGEANAAAKGQEAVSKNKDKIFNDANAPVTGNPKGDITIVEFFDYSCGYCKMAQEHVSKLLAEDKNIRFVYKELPILGPKSQLAAQAALASVAQGKYTKFHEALMGAKEALSEESIMTIAKATGLDTDKLKKDMGNEKIQAMIKDNVELAGEIGAHGTPTFVIGEKVYGGAVPYEQMKEAVATARKNVKK